jgi:hypothetical protein
VNRRVAAKDHTVSPFSSVHFINADDRFAPMSLAFVEAGESVPFEMPILLAGIDLSYGMEHLRKRLVAKLAGEAPPPPLDTDEINKRNRRRP